METCNLCFLYIMLASRNNLAKQMILNIIQATQWNVIGVYPDIGGFLFCHCKPSRSLPEDVDPFVLEFFSTVKLQGPSPSPLGSCSMQDVVWGYGHHIMPSTKRSGSPWAAQTPKNHILEYVNVWMCHYKKAAANKKQYKLSHCCQPRILDVAIEHVAPWWVIFKDWRICLLRYPCPSLTSCKKAKESTPQGWKNWTEECETIPMKSK